MKTLTSILFCMFALLFFSSCEPEEVPKNVESEIILSTGEDPIGETGDQKDDIYDKKDRTGN